ncbi:hypothetical protein ACFV30_27345 [Streptomyces sp. NPDC059752]|uniref:hypothetical protein n=1 Tax=Streptomyces sp. NPDC059752 TaxID=3346932 RepID=UPI0036662A31
MQMARPGAEPDPPTTAPEHDESAAAHSSTGLSPWAVAAGPRRLWDEITAAYRRWEELGRPSVDRYGLTMTSGGTAVWVDSPAITVAAR